MRTKSAGFTLIELMVVVVIIGILAMIAFPRFTIAGWHAKEKEADSILKQIYEMHEIYRIQYGSHARSLDQLEDVGFREPNLEYYRPPAPDQYALPLCLASRGDWANRQIDATGQLSGC